MQYDLGIFNTDRVNRARIWIPASVLMHGEEEHHRECARRGAIAGVPANIQHDMHRLIGWASTLGQYVDGEMVRVLGRCELPETDEERAEIEARVRTFWQHHHTDETEPFRSELITRLAPVDAGVLQFFRVESLAAMRPGIASELYPDLFTPGQGKVDKDGLSDYRDLNRRFAQVQPGVFHDPVRNLLLFAHPFFRRSLSRLNKLNDYFLRSFAGIADAHGDLRVRLKLDPDILGHPDTARSIVEMEYWRGPRYTDDIAAIPKGVTEHKADPSTNHHEDIDRTQTWWKEPETRNVNGSVAEYRTFEVEELVNEPAAGLAKDQYGCRYAHAEFSQKHKAITHFDGAIRAYDSEAYFSRIDKSIDHAGKHAAYKKLFRFDGSLPIPDWKRLLSDYFRGNVLIPEYLGASLDAKVTQENLTEATVSAQPNRDPTLVAFISLQVGFLHSGLQLYSDCLKQYEGHTFPYVEVGQGAVEKFILSRFDLSQVAVVSSGDGVLNLPRIVFGKPDCIEARMQVVVEALAGALDRDTKDGLISKAAIPLVWAHEGLVVTLTFAGDAAKVAVALKMLFTVVDGAQPPSKWIEALSKMVKNITKCEHASIIWDGVNRGVLTMPRSGNVQQEIYIPKALMEKLQMV